MVLLRCCGVSRNQIFESVDWFKMGSPREIFSVFERLLDSSKLVLVFDAVAVWRRLKMAQTWRAVLKFTQPKHSD